MIKHHISQEESFPVYGLAYADRGWAPSREVDLPDGFIERYKAAEQAWEEVQAIMGNAWEEAK